MKQSKQIEQSLSSLKKAVGKYANPSLSPVSPELLIGGIGIIVVVLILYFSRKSGGKGTSLASSLASSLLSNPPISVNLH